MRKARGFNHGAYAWCSAILGISFLVLLPTASSATETLGSFVTSDGATNVLERTSENEAAGISELVLKVNNDPVLAIVLHRSPARIVVTPVNATSSLDITATTVGTTLDQYRVRFAGRDVTWRSGDAPQLQQAAVNESAVVIAAVGGSSFAESVSRLRNVIDTVDTGATRTESLRLMDAVGPRHTEPGVQPLGGLQTYYDCLRHGCENEAGGEWSYGVGGGGCHCNPLQWGWNYCANSAAVYFMVAMHCWAEFINPFK